MIPSLSNLYDAASEIRTLLMPFAFVLCVIGIGEMGWRAGSDMRALLGGLLKILLVIGLLAAYPAAMDGGQRAFVEMRTKFTDARDARFVQLLRSRIENQPSDSWRDLGKIVPAAIGYFFQGIGRFMLLLLLFFQEFAIAGLIAVSPLLLGFLFLSPTQSLGIQFGVTSLTVLLWHVAICLVDIVIVAISDLLYAPITTGGLVQTGQNLIVVQNWLLFPFIMAFAAIITMFFYLCVPFVAGAIMKGLSGTTAALQAGLQSTLRAAGLAVGAGMTAMGAAATFGGSAAAQAALAGTHSATGSAQRIADGFGESIGGSSALAGGNGSDIPPPPPVPTIPGTTSSVTSSENPAMTAHQTAPGSFAVVDNARGTVSYHRGSIATLHTAQAAFDSHAARAQPLPPDSPLTDRTT